MVAMFYKGLDSDQKTVKEVSFSKFAQMVEQEKFEAVQIENTTLTGQLDKATTLTRRLYWRSTGWRKPTCLVRCRMAR